jgi:lipid II:glycine glycyltransferase (peptidoglycan interpeptide bridge formation enzyme)
MASGVMQSLHWAAFKRLQGLIRLHIGLFDDRRLVGGAVFYCCAKTNGAGILVAPEGPVLPWHDTNYAAAGLRLIMQRCEEFARSHGIMAIRIEPRIERPAPRTLREFGRAPVDLIPVETLQLDLRLSQEELLAAMKPKGRYNIGLSRRYGVRVHEASDREAVEKFYAVMQESSRRDGFALESRQFFAQLATMLCPAGIARFIFVEHDEETLGAMLLLTYGARATYLYGGITNQKRNLMGGYALQWAAINSAKSRGCSIYDFYGFDQFGAPLHTYSRFSQFKRQFGGRVVRLIGAQDYFFLDCLADAFIKVVNESSVTGLGGVAGRNFFSSSG